MVLYGGTNSSNVTTEVFKWRCLFHGSLGNSHSYRIDWNANGSINQIQHLGVSYANNGTKIVLYYENINSRPQMVQVFCKVPVNIGKQGNMIIVNLTNLPQPT